MKALKVILKVIMILVLFAILVQVFRAIGFTILKQFNIDTNLEFGANIKASIEIFSFLIATFLSVKSFKSKKYLKWTSIGLGSLVVVLGLSLIITNRILTNYEKSDPTLRITNKITKKLYKNMDYHLKEALSKKSSGSVVLFFKLYRDGTATITKLEGDEVFFPTVKESMKKSLPIKIEDSNMTYPRDMSIKINFRPTNYSKD